jgi:ATP-dependent DNA helicase RecG
MTLFGDLDVSTIRESPPGRQPINTYLVEPDQCRKWWDFVCKKLNEGRQAYVIAPLVDENESLAVASVESLFEELSNGQLEAFRLGLLHGRMSASEKQDTMQAFRSGQTQVLVATSIVEVGIDVANATVMTILSAQRFGLAQLHQLRGRVSRGKHAGYCGLLAEESTEKAQERLQAMVETTDGFRLAEVDFQQRGPGDLMGTQQHGMPPLRIANLQRDQAILEEARTAAKKLLEIDPGLADPNHVRLRQMALIRYGRALDLGDVG